MKIFQKFSWALALALAFRLHAATNDVPKFSGTVVDAQGHPVAGATVVSYQYQSRQNFGPVELEVKQRATTDGQGAFEFPSSPGMEIIMATNSGFAPGWRMWYNAPLEPPKIILDKPSALAGVVVDDSGQPVADAEVWVSFASNASLTDYGQRNYMFGNVTRQLFSARTSADGKFRIENFPANAQAEFAVNKAGMTLRRTANTFPNDQLPFHAGQENIKLTLDPAASVGGTVVERGTGQPIASALVGLELVAPGVSYSSLSQGAIACEADGSFHISDIAAGSYRLMAVFTNDPLPDWVADPVPVTVAAGQNISNVQLQAYKGGIVEVTVLGKDDEKPLPAANVTLNGDDYSRGGLTGTNGKAYFRLQPGQYTAFAGKQDWSQAQTQATVTEGQTADVTIELAAPSKVGGIVRDDSGAPVVGVLVGVFPNYGGNGSDARTDANGHYQLNWQQNWGGMANQTFYLVARDSERNLAAINEMDTTTTNLDMTLKPAMSVSGKVVDTKGNPVNNAMAYVMFHRENSGFTISRRPLQLDAQGRVQADALPRGERYGIYVSARGYGSGQEEMDAAQPNADHYDFPPLVLKIADRQLAGRVLGTDGAPVAGVQVWMNGTGQPNGTVITDANGRFAFDAVCDGVVSVSANSKGLYGSAQVMGGDTNVVIRFNANNRVYTPSPETLTGEVYDSLGGPASDITVVVTPSWGRMAAAKTDGRGKFSLDWQAQPGMRDAKYFAIARDVKNNLAAIESIDPKQKSVTLRLEPGLSISGTVQDTEGAPLTRADINLNMMAGNMGGMVEYGRIKLDSDGTFTIPALPMGQRYLVFARANGYGSEQRNIATAQSQTNSIQLDTFRLKVADRELAGRVLGADDKPLSGAQVNINGRGQPNGYMTTDATGHFQFKVCNGVVQIYVWAPSTTGRNNSGSAYALGGDTNVVVKMGERQRRQMVVRRIPLKPEPWTASAIMAWPAEHKTGALILLSLQSAVLLGAGGGIFWFTSKRGQR